MFKSVSLHLLVYCNDEKTGHDVTDRHGLLNLKFKVKAMFYPVSGTIEATL